MRNDLINFPLWIEEKTKGHSFKPRSFRESNTLFAVYSWIDKSFTGFPFILYYYYIHYTHVPQVFDSFFYSNSDKIINFHIKVLINCHWTSTYWRNISSILYLLNIKVKNSCGSNRKYSHWVNVCYSMYAYDKSGLLH